MLYEVAHFMRDKMPFLWDLVDDVNSLLFGLRYGRRLKRAEKLLGRNVGDYSVVPVSECRTEDLVAFFAAQPEEAFTFFRPHGFDSKSLRKLQGNKSFLAYAVKDGDKIVGYFFGRSFFWGRTFIGRIVDAGYRGRGIAKMMNRKTMEIAGILGLRVFQTISPENVASLKCAEAESTLKVVRTMPNGDLFVENLPKE